MEVMLKERLRSCRLEKGLTQKQVAKALGLSATAYSNYEQGIRQPSLEIIMRICKFYDITSDYLIGLKDY